MEALFKLGECLLAALLLVIVEQLVEALVMMRRCVKDIEEIVIRMAVSALALKADPQELKEIIEATLLKKEV